MGSCVSTEAPPAPVRLAAPTKPNSRPAVLADASFTSAASKDLSSAASSTDSIISTAAAAAQQPTDLALGFDCLEVGEPLGAGPRGAVVAATLRGADVAVKIFSEPYPEATLRQAAETSAAQRHSHVVLVLGLCADPPCLVMERCARGSLADVLQAARDDPAAAAELTWARRLRLLGDVAAGVAFLHGRSPPAAHGNLKASNCLVDGAWKAKIADMAPDGATPAADLLAFGLTMWEVLTWEAGANNLEPVAAAPDDPDGPEVRLALPKLAAFPGPPPAAERTLARYLSLMEKCLHPERPRDSDPECGIDFVRVLRELTGLEMSELRLCKAAGGR